MIIFSKIRKDRWRWYVLTPLLTVVASLLLENQYRKYHHDKETRVRVAQLSEEINESNFSLAHNNITGLCEMLYVKETVLGKLPVDNEQVLAALMVTRETSGAEMVYLMDTAGDVIASTSDSVTGISFTGKNFSFRPYFKNVIKSGEMVYYPALGVVSKKRGLYLGYPIIHNYKVAGVAVIKTGIVNYTNTLHKYDIPCAIISEDGIVYAANNASWLFKSTHYLSGAKLNSIEASRQFDTKHLLPLGYDFSKNEVKIENELYEVRKAPVFNGMWKVVGLFKKSEFSLVYFIIILLLFVILLSGFYYAYTISCKIIEIKRLSESREHYSRKVFKQIESSLYHKKGVKKEADWANLTQTITESGAEVLSSDRSAIWLFSKDSEELHCSDLFVKSTREHILGGTKKKADYKKYFSILLSDEIIVSNDLERDKELGLELNKKLNYHNIVSIIHVPIFQQDEVIGILCFEHVGVKREWSTDEQLFCERLANSIALFLTLQQKQDTADALKRSNESLIEALEEAQKSKELQKANILLARQKDELQKALQKLKDTQSKLVQSEKMASVGILTSGVAHEINNPLNFIQGGKTALEMFVCDRYPDNKKEFKPMIEMIESGIKRASTIVNSLNHFNRSSEAFDEECNLHSIIENCLVITNAKMKYRVDVEKNFCNKPFRLLGNEGKLHQVFLNIITNAEQSIPDKGIISISSKLNRDTVEVNIKDTGIGISKENMNKITDPFFTTKAPGKGTGLGVSIALSIIQEHSGTIEYKSEEGKGTVVKVTLPIQIA